jgi:sialic acid synthase SpsE
MVLTIHERDMYSKHKRRLVSTKYLKDGDELRYGKNYGFYRVKEAVEGSFLDPVWPSQSIEGKVITKDIKPFSQISWDDFE